MQGTVYQSKKVPHIWDIESQRETPNHILCLQQCQKLQAGCKYSSTYFETYLDSHELSEKIKYNL